MAKWEKRLEQIRAEIREEGARLKAEMARVDEENRKALAVLHAGSIAVRAAVEGYADAQARKMEEVIDFVLGAQGENEQRFEEILRRLDRLEGRSA